MSFPNSLVGANPGDLILYAGAFADGIRIGRFVSASAMMLRVEPYERDWRAPRWDWGKPVSMAKRNVQRRIPFEVWKGDDTFVYKLHEELKLETDAYTTSRRLLQEKHVSERDKLLDSMGAVPK